MATNQIGSPERKGILTTASPLFLAAKAPSLWNGSERGWLSHQGSTQAKISSRRLICISKGPPRPHSFPQQGPEM